MPLTLNCPKCKTPFKVRDEALGQKVKCPTCAAVLAVPANIGPTSITDIPIDPNAGRQSSPYGMAPPPVPPRPIPESARLGPDDDPETLGLDENPEDLERRLASPSMKNLGSRSRAEPTRPLNNLPTASRQRAPMPAPTAGRRSQPVSVGQDSDQFRGWRAVSRGLRLIQVGTWMLLLPVLCEAGKQAYFHFSKTLPTEQRGFLGLGTLWDEIALLYFAVPIFLGLFLILLGRIGLCRIPLSSEARGLATGGMLFELIVFVSVVVDFTLEILMGYRTIAPVGTVAEVADILPLVALLFVLLSEVWYLLFLCQIGFPVGEPKMTRRVANCFLMVVLMAVGSVVLARYQPLFGNGLFATVEAREMNILLTWSGLAVAMFIVLFLYTRLAGIARRAIWKSIQDREPVMGMVR